VPMLTGTIVFSALIIDISYGGSIRACATRRGAIVHDGHRPSEGQGQGRIDA
jgi:hypothetical protein